MPARKKTESVSEEILPKKKSAAKKSASKKDSDKKTFSSEFESHLARIKFAKADADAIAPAMKFDTCRASVAILWEIVFDLLCNSSDLSVSEFNAIAGVIQKLSSSKVDGKISDTGANARAPLGTLSQEALSKIEEQLKLL